MGVKRCKEGSCVSSACVVTGVAARRIASQPPRGWKRRRGKTTLVPTAGFHEEAATPRGDPLANVAGFCARASYPIRYRSADSTHSSYEDAPPGASDSCRSVVATPTPTPRNFRTIESNVGGVISSTYAKCASAFPDGSAKSYRAIRMSRSFACGTSVLHSTCTDVH